MPISEAHAGRTYPPTAPYPVSATKIAEFADAIGETDPAHRGPDAIAPPTFVVVVSHHAWEQMFDDPELGLALRRIVHGDQKFTFHRPVRAGDELAATVTIDKVRVRGSADIISASLEVTAGDEPVCTAAATFFHSRETAEASA
ncbi:acyl dehydratase [Friedmanniella endophytica]|uniref:Acyl dehydratase n=1 Tax=Microlunatus kandeliicorticis TaxID=1759536 RepID=A0A7W3IPV5_9ACTN|nr:MaoC family dehydratase N-terminal domain-containing protein [Microlunatus kandeliicorticis]MBA8793043.1 acyl dehydratase [Microlunatus kandeliicorticis]